MNFTEEMKQKVMQKESLTKEELMQLSEQPVEVLREAADEIRKEFCKNQFDLCTIVNGKCGKCSEDCKYCAQSAFYHTSCVDYYPLMKTEELIAHAKQNEKQGVHRYSIVTSGRRLSEHEVDQVCDSIREIRKQTGLKVCVSFGLLDETAFRKIKEAGASRVHCNLETSERLFGQVCTTHSFQDKIDTIHAAQKAGLEVCSGGIMGLGESMEDRIDMVLALRKLGIKSIPVNLLNPIPGTPYEKNGILEEESFYRILAVYRFAIPDAFIRLAGGRGLMKDKGRSCFQGGANAAISGDMLTTAGITTKTDKMMLKELQYEV